MQQHTGEQIGEDRTDRPREQAEHNELHSENGGGAEFGNAAEVDLCSMFVPSPAPSYDNSIAATQVEPPIPR